MGLKNEAVYTLRCIQRLSKNFETREGNENKNAHSPHLRFSSHFGSRKQNLILYSSSLVKSDIVL